MGLDQLIANFTVKVIENFQQMIVLSCTPTWQQEDITIIAECIIEHYPRFTIKEINQGLDRVAYHIKDHDADYWLHFECYSQSIWIEPINHQTQQKIEALFQSLMKTPIAHG